jgi:hypothetical protein
MMNRDTSTPAERPDREPSASARSDEASPRKTPATDVQAEDAGTAASGTPAESAMKQEHKTSSERGARR